MSVFNRIISRLSGIPQTYIGSTGRAYNFKQLLQQKDHFGRVWLATNGETRFILKDIPEPVFDHYNHEIQPNLPKSRFIRVPLDVIPEQRIFVFKYLDSDLLSLVRKGISDRNAKGILKDSLMGLAELHGRDVMHLNIKPDNIKADYREDDEGMIITKTQLTDLENAAYLPNDRYLKSMLMGNEDWRSPEAVFRSKLGKPSDMYSFGLVCIYARLNHILLSEDADFHQRIKAGALPDMIRLQRMVSHFGTQDSVDGLMRHLGDGEEQAASRKMLEMCWEDRHGVDTPYNLFKERKDRGDEVFSDFVRGLVDLDPKRRITAEKALGHEWLHNLEGS